MRNPIWSTLSSVVCASFVTVLTFVSLVFADDSTVNLAASKVNPIRFYESIPEGELGNVIRLGESLVEETSTHPLTKDYVGNALNCYGMDLIRKLRHSLVLPRRIRPGRLVRSESSRLRTEFSTASCEAVMEFGRRWEVAHPLRLPPGSHGCRKIRRSG